MYVLYIVVCTFVLFLLAIVFSVLLQYTDSDYSFGIFKLFFQTSILSEYFSYIMAVSFIGGEELEYPERTTDLPQVTD
jgi:hypothetical protein